MIYTPAGQPFEATAQWGTTGLTGTITVAIYDGIGGTTLAPHTSGIIEVAPGIYTATLNAPAAAGYYSVVWAYAGETAADELSVTSTTQVPVVPSPGAGMDVGDMLDQILLDRFEAEHRPRAMKALNSRYAHLWALEDWTWRYAQVPVTVSTGVQLVSALPSDFGVPIYLWDEKGSQLLYLEVGEFKDNYPPTTSQGPPVVWTVIDQQVFLGPTPSYNSSAFQTYYRRRLIPLTDETQVPDIPLEFQLSLVHGARAELLAFYNDPTAADMEQQWQMDITAMQKEYLADATGQPSAWPSDLVAL